MPLLSPLKLTVILIFLFIATQDAKAQFVSVPTSTRINTPRGPVTIKSSQNIPVWNRYNYGETNPSIKYDFTVVLLNDSAVQDRAKINIDDSIQSITFKKKGQKTKYIPADTKELYRLTPEGLKISGIPSDSCWLFRTEIGKVNFYSFIAEPGTDYVTAIQIGQDGAIVNLNKEKVIELVKENPQASKLAHKGKFVRALRAYNKE